MWVCLQQRDEVSVYGDRMVNIVREIQRRTAEFRDVPIGPLGLHIKVKDEYKEWSRPLEAAIGTSSRVAG